METFLIVGLGNPGEQYKHTRHNVGFDVVEILAQKLGIKMNKHRFRAEVGEGAYAGMKLVLARPQTFMNLSGESVVPLVQWYKPRADRIALVYDDCDLPVGALRVRPSGSPGTHNGMKSVIGLLGREDDYVLPWKCIVRIGSDIILIDAKEELPRRKRGRHFMT